MKKLHLCILVVLMLPILPAQASDQNSINPYYVEAEILSEITAIQPGQSFWIAVHFLMEPQWHIYWRNPGDTGFPTTIEWDLPEGFTASNINWPFPKAIEFSELINIGYEDETFLLVEITPPSILDLDNVEIKCEVNWLACHDVCVPGSAKLSLSNSVNLDTQIINSETVQLFAKAREQIPIRTEDWQIQSIVKGEELEILAIKPSWFQSDISSMQFFPYETDLIQYAAPQKFELDDHGYKLTVQLSDNYDNNRSQISGVLVTNDGWRGEGSEKALEFEAEIFNKFKISRINQTGSGLNGMFLALIFAFLGGMILNLMPCVLPVLSLKIMGLVHQAGENQKKRMQHGLVFSLGVLISFWILAGLLLLLRAGGEQLGWGFQLQTPEFVVVLAMILFLFGLSMFGVFEIGVSLTTVGGGATSKSGMIGSFFSGVLATVVATPCTAPFMGSALGFALSQPAYFSLLIFTFLGLGMAAPYMLLTSNPKLLRFIPKPGPWMESFKQFMGFLLLGTVLWLLWVLSLQTGSTSIILMLSSLVIVAFGGWVFGKWGNIAKTKSTRIVAQIIALVTLIFGLYLALHNVNSKSIEDTQHSIRQQGDIKWQSYTPDLVQRLRDEGKPIFIDFTAAWCLSCQVNEKVAFSSPDVQEAFRLYDIQAVKADWTNRDKVISEALAKFGRNSVPLYVLYSADSTKTPKILPEIITPGIVLQAFENLES